MIEVITVNKKFTEFFKGKGYYVLLFIGVIAIAAVAVIGSQLSSNVTDEGPDYVDLNDTEDNITAEENTQLAENNPVSEGIVNNANNSAADIAANDNAEQKAADSEGQIEYEGYADGTAAGSEDAQAAESQSVKNSTDTQDVEAEEASAVETSGTTVQADTTALNNLSFQADDDLLWPVDGNVIMNYSMDHTIYFATLMEYKCNPAIIIDAEVGTEVKAAADGIVSGIDADNEETGYTITMEIGDGYSVVYGQLNQDSASLEVGDSVKEGDVIATIAEPSKYYSIEGSNLYFQVMEDDQTVNPMLYLR